MAEVEEEPTLEEIAAAIDQADTERVAIALALILQSAWENRVQAALVIANQAIESGATIDEAIGAMQAELGTPMRQQVEQQMQSGVRILYRIGNREVQSPDVGPRRQRTIRHMDNSSLFWVENHYERFVQERIRDVSEQNFREGLGAFRSGRNFAKSQLGRQFSKSQSYWELLANSTATRTRELAHMDGFIEQGVDPEISAVLDARTSCICRTLDGTQLPVEVLAEHKNAVLDAESPEEVKEDVSPWLPCSRIRTLEAQGPEALAEAGVVNPPYHGHCRSALIRPL